MTHDTRLKRRMSSAKAVFSSQTFGAVKMSSFISSDFSIRYLRDEYNFICRFMLYFTSLERKKINVLKLKAFQ